VEECIAVERKILNLFKGGCQLPLGAYCEKEEDTFKVWTAMATEWNQPIRTLYNESSEGAVLAERVVKKLQSFKPVSVYITRDLREEDFFFHVLTAKGCDGHGLALIDTQRIIAPKIPKTDWIFFSSKNGVKHFLAQTTVEPGVKLAAVGKGTSEELRKHNLRADFIGGTADTRVIAKQFGAVAGRGSVLFPQAKGSMRTVQEQIPAVKVINLTVYETITRPADDIPACDVMVFTSPSNVEAFFEKNTLSKNQKVVAMGHATGSTLKEKGIVSFVTPSSFDDAGLVRAVMGVSLAEIK
jgi:uroporphyrinogen-III synthase